MEVSDAFRILGAKTAKFFGRYHFLLFFMLAAGGLSVATILLYQTLTTPAEEPQASTSASFDDTTIKRIRKLKSAGNAQSTPPPANDRTNPF